MVEKLPLADFSSLKPICPTISILELCFKACPFSSEGCTGVSFFYDVLNVFSGTLEGHVPVLGPVKCGFAEPHELSTSKTSS